MTKPLPKNKATEIIGQITYSSPTKQVYDVFFSLRKHTTYDVQIEDTKFIGRSLSSDSILILQKLGCALSTKFKDYKRTYPTINDIL